MASTNRKDRWKGNAAVTKDGQTTFYRNGQPTQLLAISKMPNTRAVPYTQKPFLREGTSENTSGSAADQAKAAWQQKQAQKPGPYQSQWDQTMNDIINKILNRKKFSYDLNGDALYQQYKDRYIQQGQQAMMDTMGQAAAMTGGYGNSYAQSVGQQTYQEYLQGLNDKIPELYELALSKYQMEGDALMNQYGVLAERENTDYGRYRDQVSDHYTDVGMLGDQYYNERSFEYGAQRDAVSDAQWQAEFEEAQRQYNQQYELANGGGSGSGSSGGGGGGGSYNSDTAATQQMLRDAGYDIAVDGVWGPETQAAYEEYNNGTVTADQVINTLRAQFPDGLVTDSRAWERAAEMVGGADVLRNAGLSVKAGGKVANGLTNWEYERN